MPQKRSQCTHDVKSCMKVLVPTHKVMTINTAYILYFSPFKILMVYSKLSYTFYPYKLLWYVPN